MKNLGEINATLPEGFEIVVSGGSSQQYTFKKHGLQYEGQWVTQPEYVDIRPLTYWTIREYVKIARRLNGGMK